MRKTDEVPRKTFKINFQNVLKIPQIYGICGIMDTMNIHK